MADYGLLPTGFAKMRMPEIKAAIVADLKARTGLDFDTDPESVTGQFISIFAEREAALWEVAEAVYSAMYPPSASGQALDDAVSFTGVTRIQASKTSVICGIFGTRGTVIPANSVIASTQSGGNYLLKDAVTINQTLTYDYTYDVGVSNSTLYRIWINEVPYSFTSSSAATITEILNGLKAAVAGLTDISVDLSNNKFRLFATPDKAFKLSSQGLPNFQPSPGIGAGSPGVFIAQVEGPLDPPLNSLTRILTLVNGWQSVNNPVPASVGRYQETDAELRLRYNQGTYLAGAGNIDSIAANLKQKVKNVTYAKVYQNVGNTTDADGRPAHSIEAVVVGGLDQDIRNLLLKQTAGGIETHGTTSGTAIDSQGTPWTIKFSRPAKVTAWLKVTVSKYTEENLPDNAAALIADAVVATGNSLGVAKDIILQRFHGPIYAAVPGIGSLTITVATGSAPTSGDYTGNNVAIGFREISTWDASRVTVTIL